MTKSESNGLSKRIRRYADVSVAVAGAGVRTISASGDRKRRAEILRAALGGLKGPLMKIAQMLSTIPDLVPDEYAAEFSKLQADAPPMGRGFVNRRMTAELGADWEKKFRKFELDAAAAASLGQIHKAIGKGGERLACKLQYPDMKSVVEADLAQLKVFFAIFEKFDRAVDTGEVHREIADRMREELDYSLELKRIEMFRRMLGGEGGVHVPETYNKLSTDRLLTMSWLEGAGIAEAADKRNLDDRNQIALNLFRAWYLPLYKYGIIHGDPHLGNYTARRDNGINLLDFGCVRVFSPQLVGGIIALYRSLAEKRPELSVEAYKAWGFVNPSKQLVEILNIWSNFIYAPVLEDKKRLIEETNTGLYGREVANRMHRELRKIGGVKIPREFVFMDRAAVGLGSVFLRLRAELNWHRAFNELINDFSAAKLAEKQKKVLLERACQQPFF